MITITKLKYPKSVMLGEDYNTKAVTAETQENISGLKIETTWLEAQPPFDVMGVYPLQIKISSPDGESVTEEVEVFAYTKPNDGYNKFMITKYKDEYRLYSFGCPNNHKENAIAYSNTSSTLFKPVSTQNSYAGQQGYTFNQNTKEWDYVKDYTGYCDYTFRPNPYGDTIYYSNFDVYNYGQTELIYEADEVRKDLPQWNEDMIGRLVVDYTDVKTFDETIEAYFIRSGSYNSVSGVYAYCFRKLSGDKMPIHLMARSKNKPTYHPQDTSAEYMLLRLNTDGTWRDTGTLGWRKITSFSSIDSSNTEVRYANLMNSLLSSHRVEIIVTDINGEYGQPLITHKAQAEGRNAKYRLKNENGEYDVIHFETSMEQVVGLEESMDALESEINDRYTKAEVQVLMNDVEQEITTVEDVAQKLSERLDVVEGELPLLSEDLTNEIQRATDKEAELQSQIKTVTTEVEKINHAETGVLKQSKDYTDLKAAELEGILATDLSQQLESLKTNVDEELSVLTNKVSSDLSDTNEKIQSLDERVNQIQSSILDLESEITDLSSEDAQLTQSIKELKDVLSNRGSDTLVFATYDEFTKAELNPKIGDLAYVIENKRAYIYQGEQGWILFDEITTNVDLADYIKQGEVESLAGQLNKKIADETERSTQAIAKLESSANDLKATVQSNSGLIQELEETTAQHYNEISSLKQDTYTKEEVEFLIDEAVMEQMACLGTDEPINKKIGHIWLELISELESE